MNVANSQWWARTKRSTHESACEKDGGEDSAAPLETSASETSTFEALVQRQSRFVFRVAYAVLRNSYDAEDVVQETFLKLYRANAWHEIADEKAFLARSAWRLAVDRLPKRAPNATFGDGPVEELISDDASPEQSAISASTSEAIHRLIDSLPEELRQPLALSAIEELNSREIAAMMNIAEGTVRTRLMRARQMLKEKLAAAGVGER